MPTEQLEELRARGKLFEVSDPKTYDNNLIEHLFEYVVRHCYEDSR
jgi:hypothetical protein